ncbi:MAG TPA: glycosyltransferase family 4 protein [Opitutaceae bacterium]|nr:glycosyltransferase family 4 protein [Opitutaceae bacterium]
MSARQIAYLTPLYFDERSYLGGGERYPMNMATGIVVAARGEFEVVLVSYGSESMRRALRPGVTLRVLKAAGRPAHALDVVSWELPDAIAAADLVHIHTVFTRCSEMGLLVAKQQGKPICVTDYGGQSSTLGAELGMLDLADRIICYSDFGASLVRERTRTRTPIDVIKGGVDGGKFTPPPAGGPRPPRDRVLFVGRLLPHKGIDRLIAALPPDLPLTVCGRPYSEDYYRLLRNLAAGKRVEFVTDADDEAIQRLYWQAWVNVLPSVYRDCYGHTHLWPELMGLTLLESMASGTPVICSRVAAMPEFVRDGQTGFIFDGPEQLAGQLRRLAGDPALVERLGASARREVENEYDVEVVGPHLLAIYRELIARRKEAAA